ncbi:hypothetical protein [Cellulosimicrobium sp. NPDC057862]|uniref:hypothetical protein n=1 Tax=Cellulosimicrobium sp. NPDC057862 TaxID=3346266 RepID=UPI00366EED4A
MIFLGARVTRWLTDVPQPGLVEIQLDDVDGCTHRLVEKSAVVDSTGVVRRDGRFPIAVGLACRPRTQYPGLDAQGRVNAVDLSPWGIGDDDTVYAIGRENLTWAPPAVYSDLSVRARQAAGLVTFRRWRASVGLSASELDALEEHLWQYALVTPETFDAWHEADPLTGLASSGSLPAPLLRSLEASGIDPVELRSVIVSLIEITYGGLFGRIESRRSLSELATVIAFAQRQGVAPAPADAFADCLWIDDDWGRPTESIVSSWRAVV